MKMLNLLESLVLVQNLDDVVPEEHVREDHDMVESQILVDTPWEMIIWKRRITWVRDIIKDAEKYGYPDRFFRENKRPRPYSIYVALLFDIIDAEPSSYEEATNKKVLKDAMIEEYQSIMKNDALDVVARPKGKSMWWLINGSTREII